MATRTRPRITVDTPVSEIGVTIDGIRAIDGDPSLAGPQRDLLAVLACLQQEVSLRRLDAAERLMILQILARHVPKGTAARLEFGSHHQPGGPQLGQAHPLRGVMPPPGNHRRRRLFRRPGTRSGGDKP